MKQMRRILLIIKSETDEYRCEFLFSSLTSLAAVDGFVAQERTLMRAKVGINVWI